EVRSVGTAGAPARAEAAVFAHELAGCGALQYPQCTASGYRLFPHLMQGFMRCSGIPTMASSASGPKKNPATNQPKPLRPFELATIPAKTPQASQKNRISSSIGDLPLPAGQVFQQREYVQHLLNRHP